jgi:tRNA nucleotidyltransferase/poly(A) polymerase
MNSHLKRLDNFLNSDIKPLVSLFRKTLNDCHNVDHLYLVGGTIRDVIMGKKPSDPDFAISGDINEFVTHLQKNVNFRLEYHQQFINAQIHFDQFNFAVDISSLRSETYPSPGALPIVTPIMDINEDLKRRDFTVNAIGLDITKQNNLKLFDPHNGLEDIRTKTIRVLHKKSFQDDPTRLFRAVRYSIYKDLEIETNTRILVKSSLKFLKDVSKDRVNKELIKLISGPNIKKHLNLAKHLGILRTVDPQSTIMTEFDEALEPLPDDLLVKLGILLSAATETQILDILCSLGFTNNIRSKLRNVPKTKILCNSLSTKQLDPSKIKLLCEKIPSEILESHKVLCGYSMCKTAIERYLSVYKIIKADLNGNEIIKLGVPPGPKVKSVLDLLLENKLDGKLKSKKASTEYVRDLVKKNQFD